MKKLVTLAMVALMLLTFCTSAFATPGAFVESPSYNEDIMLIDFECDDPTWNLQLVVTPYKNRAALNEARKGALESAYATIAANTNVATFAPDVTKVATVAADKLAVSDLFFVHEEAKARVATAADKTYTIEIKCNRLNQFQALLNCVDGTWTVVEGAKVNAAGNLEFTTKTLDSFAVVMSTETPETGDNTGIIIAIAVGSVAAATVIWFAFAKKKQRA